MVIKQFKILQVLIIAFFSMLNMYSFSQIRADFSATSTSGCSPITVNFKNTSTGGATSWQWDLGNGTTSTLQDPSVTYFNPGTYTVKLTASGASGSNTISKTNFITVYANPTTAFNVSTLTGCYPLNVSFIDQSIAGSGTIATWQWDFGDGNISTAQAPTHIYQNTGLFNVTLTVKSSNGCSKTLTKPNLINISEGVRANFSNTSPNGCALPATINFTNQSVGNSITGYLWNFGDSQTSTGVNPSHTYTAAGVYTVTLTATNATGCSDVIIKQNQIYIGTAKADFTIPSNVCTGNTFKIINNSLPAVGLQHSTWDFGDGTSDTLADPQKKYTTPGTYTVKLTVDYGGCIDVTTKTITVLEGPVISFTSNAAQACQAPFAVTFANTTVGGTVVLWDFGDGITSKLPNPTHTYTKLGSYTVKLTAANANGCMSTLTIPSFINVGPSKIVKIDNLPAKGCIPYTANFSATLYPVLPGTTYKWDFGDGATSTLATPSHLYSVEGSYNIKLIITTAGGCSDTLIVSKGVTVGTKPHAAFTAQPLLVCPNDPVTFTDLSTGGADSFFWFFGDGGTSSAQNPIYLYQDTGYKTVTFIATRSGCSDTTSIKNYVFIRPPIARFSDSVVCSNQYQHFFTDHSIVDTAYAPINYLWHFGDGDSSILHSPSHLYADTGRYQVTLFVSDSACHHQTVRPVYILNEHAGFNNLDSIGCGSLTKLFFATSHPQYIASYLWNFGDGKTLLDTISPNTSHTYDSTGTYNVALKVVDLNNCPDSITKPINVTKHGPTANFGIPASMCVNSSVFFTDSSKSDPLNKIVKWTWDFGDSSAIQSFARPPFSHVYKKRGLFDITLTVTDSTGCTDTRFQAGTIGVNGPTASFYAQNTVQCLNTSLKFTNTSIGYIVASVWDFGDGTIDNGFDADHIFTTLGDYTIKLTVTDSSGCVDTVSKPGYLQVSNAKALFSMSDSFTHCPPLLVKFSDTSNNMASVNWDFGDGNTSILLNPSHTYTMSGVFNAKLLVTGNGGCIDTLVKVVTIEGPYGNITYGPIEGCTPLIVNFKSTAVNTDLYTWDFDDGSTVTSTNSIATHIYKLSGSYLPKIILADSLGCKIPIYGDDSIRVKMLTPHIEELPKYLICDSAIISFIDSTVSNDTLKSFLWSFGDGQTSTVQNPTHYYSSVGNYIASYTVTTVSGCIGYDTLHIPIKVVPTPQTQILGPDSVCITNKIQFTGQWLNQDTSTIYWKWDLGNGQTSNLQNPVLQTYPAAGVYHITSTTTNASGCVVTAMHNIDILPVPNVDAGPGKTICLGKADSLSASGAFLYKWKIQPTLSCLDCPNPLATPNANQMYWVTGIDEHGCTALDSVLVKVKQPFLMSTGPGDTLCIGQTFRLLATGAERYIWSPSTYLSNPLVANPIAKPDSSITYRVIGYDTAGCFVDTGYISIKVSQLPTVDIIENEITITAGSSIQLHSTNSNDVTHLHWSPPVGLSCVSCGNPIASPKEKTTYTLTVTNDGGCTAQDKVDILVLCGDANIFIPNTFSPNNDGANDVFYPRGRGVYAIKAMRVFSRWGQLIFEKTNFQPNDISSGWDGSFNGQKLTPDVFVYIIDVICENNQKFTLKGNVTLLK